MKKLSNILSTQSPALSAVDPHHLGSTVLMEHLTLEERLNLNRHNKKHLSGIMSTSRVYRTGKCTVMTMTQTTSTLTSYHQKTVSEQHNTLHTLYEASHLHTKVIKCWVSHLDITPSNEVECHSNFLIKTLRHVLTDTITKVIPSLTFTLLLCTQQNPHKALKLCSAFEDCMAVEGQEHSCKQCILTESGLSQLRWTVMCISKISALQALK